MTIRYIAAGDLIWGPAPGGFVQRPVPEDGVVLDDGARTVYLTARDIERARAALGKGRAK